VRADKNRVGNNAVTFAIFLVALFTFAAFSARAAATPTAAEDGTILQAFPGASGPGYKPTPDTTGAVGPRHVVDFADSSFTVHDKATGKVLVQLGMANGAPRGPAFASVRR